MQEYQGRRIRLLTRRNHLQLNPLLAFVSVSESRLIFTIVFRRRGHPAPLQHLAKKISAYKFLAPPLDATLGSRERCTDLPPSPSPASCLFIVVDLISEAS
ncbi:hypothetical protein L1987_64875 [Smallanthus sonchifolius]|uniref:Uncharacterized protein n=1 Tax=Smallanthus sonchifolius TaxID=185202 RepID=A0ACB9BSY9_9ASTR|nr:hypothetical protein L1987_64875 [Smallanthus sonchifolius]